VGHLGFQKTYAHSHLSFFSTGMKKDILQFIIECKVFQLNKDEIFKSLSIIQPLPIPSSLWTKISMDFIVGLYKVHNNFFIMVVVDFLSKYAHFCPLPHPFTPPLVAQVFIDNIFKLHGMLTSIVSDHDPNLTNTFL
jgi:hypothetical protein